MGHIEFTIHKAARCVHFRGTGTISIGYLIEQIKVLQRHPDFDFSFNSFIDFENATVPFEEAGFDDYASFVEARQQAKIHRKWSIYTKDEITFQSANMSHLFESGSIDVGVFQNREAALAFLGITDDDLSIHSEFISPPVR